MDWLPNFPHKVWVDQGEGSFTCLVNRRGWESTATAFCIAIEVHEHDHYTTTAPNHRFYQSQKRQKTIERIPAAETFETTVIGDSCLKCQHTHRHNENQNIISTKRFLIDQHFISILYQIYYHAIVSMKSFVYQWSRCPVY